MTKQSKGFAKWVLPINDVTIKACIGNTDLKSLKNLKYQKGRIEGNGATKIRAIKGEGH